jgi:hypothetical protein
MCSPVIGHHRRRGCAACRVAARRAASTCRLPTRRGGHRGRSEAALSLRGVRRQAVELGGDTPSSTLLVTVGPLLTDVYVRQSGAAYSTSKENSCH